MSTTADNGSAELYDTVGPDKPEPEDDAWTGPEVSRRDAMKLAVGAAAAAAVATSGTGPALAQDDDDDDDDDESSGWYSTAVGTYVGVTTPSPGLGLLSSVSDWLSGDSNEAQEDSLRADAVWDFKRYHNSVKREISVTDSMLDYLLDGIFEDSKLAAIEEINNQESQQTVEDAAIDHATELLANLQENIAEAGNEGMTTAANYVEMVDENGLTNVIIEGQAGGNDFLEVADSGESDLTLLDGSTHPAKWFEFVIEGRDNEVWSWHEDANNALPYGVNDDETHPVAQDQDDDDGYPVLPTTPEGNNQDKIPPEYESEFSLQEYWNGLEDRWTNDLEPDIKTWVANAYDAVAAGDIHTEDLLSSVNIAQTIAEDEPANRAYGSLRAAGIPADANHPAHLEIDGPGQSEIVAENVVLGTTVEDKTIGVGDTINPATQDDGEYIVNFEPSNIAVEWPYFDDTIDGGTATINRTPSVEIEDWLTSEMVMQIHTNHGETATIDPYEHGDRESPEDPFQVDLSDQLEVEIAEIEEIWIYSDHADDPNGTLFLDSQAEVVDIADVEQLDGEELDYSHDREIHTTDNYVTQEEWDSRQEDLQATLDELEDDGFSGLPGLGGFGDLLSDVFGSVAVGVIVILAGVVAAIAALR